MGFTWLCDTLLLIGWRLAQSLGCAPEPRRLKGQSGVAVIRRLWSKPQPAELVPVHSSTLHR